MRVADGPGRRIRSATGRGAALAALLTFAFGCGVERQATRPGSATPGGEPPAGAAAPLTDDLLADATYPMDVGEVTLHGGVGSFEGEPVRLLTERVRGDLDRDGDEDVVVLLEIGDREAAHRLAISVADNDHGAPRAGRPVLLRPGARLEQITLSDRVVQVELLELGVGDAPCCPTIRTERRFAFAKGGLVPAH